MFLADIVPATYCEARKEAEAQRALLAQKLAAAAAANNNQKDEPKLAQPSPQRPAGPARTFSSAFFGLFPSAPASSSHSACSSAVNSQASSTTTSPSATPMPSPSLNGPKQSWFAPRPVPKATDMDIACLPPAWS